MQNNSVRSNVWAFATGKCIDFKTADGTPQHYCPGHFWHCAYRYQQCGFEFRSNILVSGNSDNDYWHQPAEGYCNVTSSRNLYFNRTGAGLSSAGCLFPLAWPKWTSTRANKQVDGEGLRPRARSKRTRIFQNGTRAIDATPVR